jgi:hypothetical protein
MNTPTIKTKNRQKQAEIARKTAEYLAKGGKVSEEEIRRGKHVDLSFRYYAGTGRDEE